MESRKSSTLFAIVCCVFCLSPINCFSAPKITSVSMSSSNLIISGTEFGSKPTAAPLKWENFENGTEGSDITSTGYWSMKLSGIRKPVFTSANKRGASNLSILHTNDGVPICSDAKVCGMAQFWRNNIGFAATKKAYISYWTRFDWGQGVAGEISPYGGYQIKPVRLARSIKDDSNPVYPAISNVNWWNSNGSKSVAYTLLSPDDNAHTYINSKLSSSFQGATSVPSYDSGVWVNVKIQYSASSAAGVADATYKVWTQKSDGTGYTFKDVNACPGGTCSFIHPGPAFFERDLIDSIKFEYNFDNVEHTAGAQITPQTDDIYMDNSWARVEICDANTYEGARHCEMQIPTAWTDKQVKVNFNSGSFKAGQKVYVYVIDSDGVVSSDVIEYTIGAASGAATPPAQPIPPERIPGNPNQ